MKCWQCDNEGKSLWSMTIGSKDSLCVRHKKEDEDFANTVDAAVKKGAFKVVSKKRKVKQKLCQGCIK